MYKRQIVVNGVWNSSPGELFEGGVEYIFVRGELFEAGIIQGGINRGNTVIGKIVFFYKHYHVQHITLCGLYTLQHDTIFCTCVST